MDGYFVAPPMPVTQHAPTVPMAVAIGNSNIYNRFLGFWSVRGLWTETYWRPQSETQGAAVLADVQPPVYVPCETMIPVIMVSW